MTEFRIQISEFRTTLSPAELYSEDLYFEFCHLCR